MATTNRRRPCAKLDKVGLALGFRSGFELDVFKSLEKQGIEFSYESEKINYEVPATKHTYTPDFIITTKGTGKTLYIETKGRFMSQDRKKHLHIRKSNPSLDIRFVFMNPNNKISKGSKTTYAMWCNKNGFKFAKKDIPKEWINE